jgi:hypothetical protein
MWMEKALVSEEYNVKITVHQDPTSYRKLVFHFYFISFFLLFLASTFSCLVISFQGATVFFFLNCSYHFFVFLCYVCMYN